MFALRPSKRSPICSQISGLPERSAAWARCLLPKMIPSHRSISSGKNEGHYMSFSGCFYTTLLQKQGLLTCFWRNQTTNSDAVDSMHYPLSYIVTLCYTGPVLFHRDACPLWVMKVRHCVHRWPAGNVLNQMIYLSLCRSSRNIADWDKQRLVTHLSSVSHSVSKRFSSCGLHQNNCKPSSLY